MSTFQIINHNQGDWFIIQDGRAVGREDSEASALLRILEMNKIHVIVEKYPGDALYKILKAND